MKAILAYGPALDARLAAFITDKQASISPASPLGADFLERLQPFATAGKLLRGSLACFSYQAFSGEAPTDPVFRAAAALELVHSALLIHDDIMDDDDLRRGQPALHQQYRTVGQVSGLLEARRFGVNMALCAGDATLFLAFELLTKIEAEPSIRTVVNQLFSDQLLDTCIGQMQDTYFEARPDMPSKRAIYSIMRAKTAAYTLALPLAVGAALAGQKGATLRRLQAFGTAAGTIFQVRDDELGVMGDPSKTGKPVGSDIQEGKKTLLYYYLLKRCRPGDKRVVKALFGKPDISTEEVELVQAIARRYKIEELLDHEIGRLRKRALAHLDQLVLSRPAKTELVDLVAFCARRQA
jgi:geranylgeranyl diphosphate synthase type I